LRRRILKLWMLGRDSNTMNNKNPSMKRSYKSSKIEEIEAALLL
jgi:hypothetical protein